MSFVKWSPPTATTPVCQRLPRSKMAKSVVPWIPLWAYDAWVARGVDWLVMSEDLPALSNQVQVDDRGRIHLHYTPNNTRAHLILVKETKRILRRLGYPVVIAHSHGAKNTTHQCGTLVFGTDPAGSVLDPFCRAHDLENLFVVNTGTVSSLRLRGNTRPCYNLVEVNGAHVAVSGGRPPRRARGLRPRRRTPSPRDRAWRSRSRWAR